MDDIMDMFNTAAEETATNSKDFLKVDDFKVLKATKKNGKITFNLEINGIRIYQCRAMKTKEGKVFISFPSYKGSDDKYYPYCSAYLSEDDSNVILNAVAQTLT